VECPAGTTCTNPCGESDAGTHGKPDAGKP
jgi:hypothetical protein